VEKEGMRQKEAGGKVDGLVGGRAVGRLEG